MEAHHSPVAKRRVAIMQLVIVEVSGVVRPVRADVTVGTEVCAAVSHAPDKSLAAARITKPWSST